MHRHAHALSSPLHHTHPYAQTAMRYDGAHDAINAAAAVAGYGLIGAAARYQFSSSAFNNDNYSPHAPVVHENSVSLTGNYQEQHR